MNIMLGFQPWLGTSLKMLGELAEIGFQVTDKDVDDLIEEATIIAVDGQEPPTP